MKVEYGKWYECKEGSMPEDLLEHITSDNKHWITPEVIVPHLWGNEKGCGSYYPVVRCKVGNGKWKWMLFNGKPLYWMIILPPPNPNLKDINTIEQLQKLYVLE